MSTTSSKKANSESKQQQRTSKAQHEQTDSNQRTKAAPQDLQDVQFGIQHTTRSSTEHRYNLLKLTPVPCHLTLLQRNSLAHEQTDEDVAELLSAVACAHLRLRDKSSTQNSAISISLPTGPTLRCYHSAPRFSLGRGLGRLWSSVRVNLGTVQRARRLHHREFRSGPAACWLAA